MCTTDFLKAWCHWVSLEPDNEISDRGQMAKDIRRVLAELYAARAVVEAVKKAFEDACYLPNYVDDAFEKYIEATK